MNDVNTLPAPVAELGLDFLLEAPSAYRVEARCTRCGHMQFPYAIRAVFEETEAGTVMVSCSTGSSGDFCDRCEDEASLLPDDVERPSCLTMELVGWGLAFVYEDSDGNAP